MAAGKQQLLYKAILFNLYSNVSTYFTAPIKMSYRVINLGRNVFGIFFFRIKQRDKRKENKRGLIMIQGR